MDTETIVICTKDEMVAMHERGEVNGDGFVIDMKVLFEVLCDYYGTDPHWQPNDVY